jgi:hypothetical protein
VNNIHIHDVKAHDVVTGKDDETVYVKKIRDWFEKNNINSMQLASIDHEFLGTVYILCALTFFSSILN